VTFHDLREIHTHYPDFRLQDIVNVFPLGEEYADDEHLHHNTPLRFEIPGWPAEGYLGIRFVSDKGDIICPFLELPSNKCRIYEHRPILCRKYPYGCDVSGEMIIQQVRCPGRKRLNDEEMEEISLLIDSVWSKYWEYQQEAAEWNLIFRGKSKSAFFQFVFR
jgi:Fe-S-cluster containining protein